MLVLLHLLASASFPLRQEKKENVVTVPVALACSQEASYLNLLQHTSDQIIYACSLNA